MGFDSFYLLNPFFLLFNNIEYEALPMMFGIVSIINASMGGLNMYILLSDIHHNRRSDLIFSTSYALIGYSSVNCFQLMLLTGTWMLPVVALGIRKILQKKSPALYSLSIAASLIMNFYTGYMICMASVFIFGVFFCLKNDAPKNDRIALLKTYTLSSVLGGGLSAFMWFPAVLSLMNGRVKRVASSDFAFTENFPFLEIFTKLFTGAENKDELVSGHPAIFCGILVVALVILFFLDPKVEKKKKTGAAAILLIYILSFYVTTFTSVFHGFNRTFWFPFRYAFVFSFLMICIASEEFSGLRKISYSNMKKMFLLLIIASIIIFSKTYAYVSGTYVLIDLGLLALFGLVTWFYREHPQRSDYRSYVGIMLILVCLNLYFNYFISVKNILDWGLKEDEYVESIQGAAVLTDAVKQSDDSFYRMENDDQRTGNSGNDPMFFGYNGVGNSSSCERVFVNKGLSKFGVSWYEFRNSYDAGITASMDSLLGIKYVISDTDLTKEKSYTLKVSDMFGKNLYENPYALPIAILSESDLSQISLDEREDIFEIQNDVWSALTGNNKKLFTKATDISYSFKNTTDPMTLTDSEVKNLMTTKDYEDEEILLQDTSAHFMFSFVAAQDGPVYFYNAGVVNENEGTMEDALQYVGTYKKGETVEGGFYIAGEINQVAFEEYCKNFQIYYANMDTLNEYSSFLQSQKVSIEKNSDTLLTGSVYIENDNENLLFTIPYDEGWHIVVDGRDMSLNCVMNLFMGISLAKGQHDYKMYYAPEGFRIACLISILSLLILLYALFFEKRLKNKTKPDRSEKASEQKEVSAKTNRIVFLLSGLIGAVAFLMIYGVKVLDVTYDDWLLAFPEGSDNVQHYMGWVAYRSSAWHFPLGLVENIVYPDMISVIYTDSIPLLAFIFKVLSPLLPQTFQYFGWFGLVSGFLLAGFGGIFVLHFTGRPIQSVMSSVFFATSYVFIFRMFYHTGLAAQWIIIASLYLWLCVSHSQYAYLQRILWPVLSVIALLTEAYFVPMVWGIMLCSLFMDVVDKNVKKPLVGALITICVSAVATIVTGYIFGLFYGDVSAATFGVYDYSFNLNGFINSFGMSRLLPQLPAGYVQYEGFSYLGLGMILLVFLGLFLYCRNREKTVIMSSGKRNSIILFFVAFVLFAASPWIRIGNFIIDIPLPSFVVRLWSIFRSTGRMIWPVYYLIMLFGCVLFIKNFKSKRFSVIVLGALLCVQLYDQSEYLYGKHEKYANEVTYNSPLKSQAWEELSGKYRHIMVYPDTYNMYYSYKNEQIQIYAQQNNMTMNIVYLSRDISDKVNDSVIDYFDENRKNKTFPDDTMYYFPDTLPDRDYGLYFYNIDGYVIATPSKEVLP